MGAGQNTCRRRYITFGIAGALSAAVHVVPVLAQARVTETHSFSEPEGRLLGFYSAAMAFSPAGIAPDQSRLSFQLEVSHVPSLNRAQRRPSIDKPESTNLAPFFPRPRGMLRLGAWTTELSWIPPMKVFDVTANLASAAITAPALSLGSLHITPRVWGMTGRVEGAMTCSTKEMLGKGADLELYYNTVCHGNQSKDWFEPRMLGAEAIAVKSSGGGGSRLYALLGGRVDRTKFDIGVITFEGDRDAEHPILQLRTVRPHAAIGGTWKVRREVFAGAEAFYAPGSLLTVRVSGRWVAKP